MILQPEDILKLLLALLLGGLIGAERELRDKAAGLRTLMFICSGSALFTILSARLASPTSDPNRIAAQIVTGIGFLGAGVIMVERGEIHGLTTAAMIWLVAALGVGVGGGQYLLAIIVTVIVLFGLLLFPSLERLMNRVNQTYTYEITIPVSQAKYQAMSEHIRVLGLRVHSTHRRVHKGAMACTWIISGRPKAHEALIQGLIEDPEVKAFEV